MNSIKPLKEFFSETYVSDDDYVIQDCFGLPTASREGKESWATNVGTQIKRTFSGQIWSRGLNLYKTSESVGKMNYCKRVNIGPMLFTPSLVTQKQHLRAITRSSMMLTSCQKVSDIPRLWKSFPNVSQKLTGQMWLSGN